MTRQQLEAKYREANRGMVTAPAKVPAHTLSPFVRRALARELPAKETYR